MRMKQNSVPLFWISPGKNMKGGISLSVERKKVESEGVTHTQMSIGDTKHGTCYKSTLCIIFTYGT